MKPGGKEPKSTSKVDAMRASREAVAKQREQARTLPKGNKGCPECAHELKTGEPVPEGVVHTCAPDDMRHG